MHHRGKHRAHGPRGAWGVWEGRGAWKGPRPFGALAHRLVAITLVAVLIPWSLFHLFYAHERLVDRLENMAFALTEKVLLVDRLYRTSPHSAREDLLDAVHTPFLDIRIQDRPPPLPERSWRHAQEIDGPLRAHVAAQAPAPFILAYPPDPPAEGGFRGEVLLLALAQEDGHWLVARARLFTLGSRGTGALLFWSFLTLATVATLVVLASRRMTRPLTTFAQAAQRLGEDVNAPPLAERGPQEVRSAARAFNDMQRRIQGLLGERTQMLAALSHDLKTILTRLRLRIDLLDDEDSRERSLADIEIMTAMVEDGLATAREEHAKEPRRAFDLAALLETLIQERRDLGQSVRYHGPSHQVYEGAPIALRRVFDNLLENAVRYGGEAMVTFHQTSSGAEGPPAPDGELVILVDDEGPGMEADDLERAFEPYYRGEPSRNRATGGSGLGLAIARTIVRRHEGTIDLRNRPGGGLRAEVRLPHRVPDETPGTRR